MKKIFLLPWFIGLLSASAQIDTCVMKHTINGIVYTSLAAPLQLKSCMGLNNVNNTSDANKPVSTASQTALDGKINATDSASMLAGYARKFSPTFTGLVTMPAGSITNSMLSGSIDVTTKISGVIPFANGGISAAVAAPATTGTMTINMTASVITVTPTGACTFNGSGGVPGQIVTFSVTTSGVTSFVLTFGTNFRKTGTLSTGTTSARFFTVSFVCIDGTIWSELCRTAAQS